MSMFQKSVLNSIKQDESLVALAWAEYQKFLTKVEYIKTVKKFNQIVYKVYDFKKNKIHLEGKV